MANWPITLPTPSFGSGGGSYKPQIRNEMDGGYVQSRPAFTRAAMDRMQLKWDDMAEAHFATLKTFFSLFQGSEITNFPTPGTGVMKSIRFTGDKIDWTWNEYGNRTVSVEVEDF